MRTKGATVTIISKRAFIKVLKFILPLVLVSCLSISAYAAYDADREEYILEYAPAYVLLRGTASGATRGEFVGDRYLYSVPFDTLYSRNFSVSVENLLVPELPLGRYLTGFTITQYVEIALNSDYDGENDGATWQPLIRSSGIPGQNNAQLTIYDWDNVERYAYVIPEVTYQPRTIDSAGGDASASWQLTYSYSLSESDYFEFSSGYIKCVSLPQFLVTYPAGDPARHFVMSTYFTIEFTAARLTELSDGIQQIITNQNENAAAIESKLDRIENALPDPDFDYSDITGTVVDNEVDQVFSSIFDDNGFALSDLALDGGFDLLTIRDGLSFWGTLFLNLEREVPDYAKLLRLWGYIALASLLVGSVCVTVGALYVRGNREDRETERFRQRYSDDFSHSWVGRYRDDGRD